MWHYHLIDVEALAVGYLYGLKRSHEHEVLPPDAYDDPAVQAAIVGSSYRSLPWRSDDLSSALGVMVSDEDRHTALGDARWARRIYQAVTDPTV